MPIRLKRTHLGYSPNVHRPVNQRFKNLPSNRQILIERIIEDVFELIDQQAAARKTQAPHVLICGNRRIYALQILRHASRDRLDAISFDRLTIVVLTETSASLPESN